MMDGLLNDYRESVFGNLRHSLSKANATRVIPRLHRLTVEGGSETLGRNPFNIVILVVNDVAPSQKTKALLSDTRKVSL